MKKVAKIVGLCSRPLQERVLIATEEERAALLELVNKERGWMIGKMRAKGYDLEGTVMGIYGIFTRGPARGTVELHEAAEPR